MRPLVLVAAALLCLAAAPAAPAHAPPAPRPECQDRWPTRSWSEHDYVAAAQPAADDFAHALVVNGNVEDCEGPCDACPGTDPWRLWDGDWEFGVGGAFLPVAHHSGTSFVVDDAAHGRHVAWYVGVDRDGDGLVSPAASDPADPDCLLGPFAGAADVTSDPAYRPSCYPSFSTALVPGWWIFIPPWVPGHLPPTSGHVTEGEK